MRNTYKNTSY